MYIRFILFFLFVINVSGLVHSQDSENREIEPLSIDTVIASKIREDSLRIQNLLMEIQELKLNEILTQNEKNSQGLLDSINRAKKKLQIDSLRAITKGHAVVVEGDTLFHLYSRRGGVTPSDRAQNIKNAITELGERISITQDSIYTFESEFVTDIMAGDKVIASISDQDALWQNTTRQELAKEYSELIHDKVKVLHEKYGFKQKMKDLSIPLLIVIIQVILIYFTNRLFKWFRLQTHKFVRRKMKPISFKNYEFLNLSKEERILALALTAFKYLIIITQLLLSLSLLFSIFPETEDFALLLLSYIWNPAKEILKSIVNFIPNLFKIGVIYIVFKYILRGIKYITNEIAAEKLNINGFYSDWALPTYNILRFLLYCFMIIIIWPLLPQAQSGIFQGISVFIGLIISLGSTSVIGNLMAGMVITYMRPFKIGDLIKLNDTMGTVIEKTPFVTRLRTSKNEIITIPNSFILSSQTVNYSASARDYTIIVNSNITVGYDVPWKQAQQLLIEAARETHGIMENPAPFVLVKELADFYCVYQINASTREDTKLPRIYSELHHHIMDKFNEAGIEIMSPHFYAKHEDGDSVMPPEFKK